MRKVRLDENGHPRCRKCGNQYFIARASEFGKSTKHLKCSLCGTRQVHRRTTSLSA